MNCKFCKYEGTDEDASHLNENIYSDDDLIVCFLYDGGLSVMPFHKGRQLATKYVPVNYCPMCGRRLGADEGPVREARDSVPPDKQAASTQALHGL